MSNLERILLENEGAEFFRTGDFLPHGNIKSSRSPTNATDPQNKIYHQQSNSKRNLNPALVLPSTQNSQLRVAPASASLEPVL